MTSTDIPMKHVFRAAEVGQIFDVSVRTVYRWAEEGTIHKVRVRGTIRIPRESVIFLLEGHHQGEEE